MIRRVVIAGFGSIGRRHFRIARELMPDAEIRVLRHARPADEGETAGADGVFYSIEEAAAFAPNLSIVATPAPFHRPIAEAMLQVGSHLLIEKPLADTVEGLEGLIALARERRRVVQTGYNLRYLPSLRRFRDLVREGGVGAILSIRCQVGQYLPDWRPEQDYRRTVSANRNLGGGVLLELSHEIDYLRWVFGEAAWVQAFLGKQSRLDVDVEDTAHLILGFAGDTSQRPVASVSLDFIRRDTVRECVAIGQEGTLRWDGISGAVELKTPGAGEWERLFQHTPERDLSYREQLRDLLLRIDSGAEPQIGLEEGLSTLRVVAAARASAAVGGTRAELHPTTGEPQ